jgi:hypothetical protein
VAVGIRITRAHRQGRATGRNGRSTASTCGEVVHRRSLIRSDAPGRPGQSPHSPGARRVVHARRRAVFGDSLGCQQGENRRDDDRAAERADGAQHHRYRGAKVAGRGDSRFVSATRNSFAMEAAWCVSSVRSPRSRGKRRIRISAIRCESYRCGFPCPSDRMRVGSRR